MTTPFLGEIDVFAFNFAPSGYALCNGQLLPISQNAALFSLLGTTYGGNGTSTFALPNLQGQAALGFGNGFVQGQTGGEQTHTLLLAEMPAHSHGLAATDASATNVPADNTVLGQGIGTDTHGNVVDYDIYVADGAPAETLAASALSSTGSSQPHNNLMPYLALNFCIALQGIFPSRN